MSANVHEPSWQGRQPPPKWYRKQLALQGKLASPDSSLQSFTIA